jgi:hypothetical protein
MKKSSLKISNMATLKIETVYITMMTFARKSGTNCELSIFYLHSDTSYTVY